MDSSVHVTDPHDYQRTVTVLLYITLSSSTKDSQVSCRTQQGTARWQVLVPTRQNTAMPLRQPGTHGWEAIKWGLISLC